MKLWTYQEVRDKILVDLDLQNESFIQPDELVGYGNEAIEEAEYEIHNLGVEDEYFLNSTQLALAQGTSAYNLPDNIYANKIRGLVYVNGAEIYGVNRIRRMNKFVIKAFVDSADRYRYDLENASADIGAQIVLYPPSRDTGSLITLSYIRKAERIPLISEGSLSVTLGSVVDIPEFISFIFKHMKKRCLDKEPGPRLQDAIQEREQARSQMINALTNQVPDDDDRLQADYTHYEDMI